MRVVKKKKKKIVDRVDVMSLKKSLQVHVLCMNMIENICLCLKTVGMSMKIFIYAFKDSCLFS